MHLQRGYWMALYFIREHKLHHSSLREAESPLSFSVYIFTYGLSICTLITLPQQLPT